MQGKKRGNELNLNGIIHMNVIDILKISFLSPF